MSNLYIWKNFKIMEQYLLRSIFGGLLLVSGLTMAQQVEPCKSSEYNQLKNPHYQNSEAYENWMAQKIAERNLQMTSRSVQDEVVTLPVVFHIIHNGDVLGSGENIPDGRIMSQLQVLNEDFRRIEGSRGHVVGTPGVDVEIQFCLAQQDPDGNPHTGINRVNLGQASWSDFDDIDGTMKGQTIWDPERYINIWVVRMGGMMSMIGGYAYFPAGAGLPGLSEAESDETIDGIVMNYQVFGSSDVFPSTYLPGYDKGRSLTHEMGHFFGLRHIWGDGNSCSATDYVADTPPVNGMNQECVDRDSCTQDDLNDQVENHMDYTPDTCKSVFTQGQKTRMRTALMNSPRRVALQSSNTCQSPLSTGENQIQKLKIYPNPVIDQMYIQSQNVQDGDRYVIYSVLGTIVKQGTVNQQGITVDELAAGVYVLEINSKVKVDKIRFVKK